MNLWRRLSGSIRGTVLRVVYFGRIFTTEGWIKEKALRKQCVRNKTDYGHTEATEYFIDDKLVRRDVTIGIDRGFLLAGGLGSPGPTPPVEEMKPTDQVGH